MSFLEFENPVRVKICGITGAADAEMAIAAGADALGFNFCRASRRGISFEESRGWISSLAGRIFRVAVVVNATRDELSAMREANCFEAVQFHGDETPDFCVCAGFPVWIRAVRVRSSESLKSVLNYETPYLLLDAWSEAAYGGTGRRPDWNLLSEFVNKQPARRVILAGGLAPENVREAVRMVQPHAVDVATGVESSPGRKSVARVSNFIRAARSAWCS
jgi:phosphoribosylanthranilate isomerase